MITGAAQMDGAAGRVGGWRRADADARAQAPLARQVGVPYIIAT
jgi:translation elongation factor EF-Tu-like GTPase